MTVAYETCYLYRSIKKEVKDKVKLKNHTDTSDAELHRMIAFVDPGLAKDVRVICKPSDTESHGFSRTNTKEVVVYIPRYAKYPYFLDHANVLEWIKVDQSSDGIVLEQKEFDVGHGPAMYKLIQRPKKTRPIRTSGLLLSKDEETVYILGHELRHQWQHRRPPRNQWAYGCQGKRKTKFAVEMDASVFGWKKVREWRRLVAPKQVYPAEPWCTSN
jgi:hypothetical protein